MALTEQMRNEAIKEAEDIDTGVDTRTKKERLRQQMDDLKSFGNFVKEEGPMFVAESTPGLGEAIAIKRTSDALDKGDKIGAAIEAASGVMGLLPIVGDVAGKTFRKIAKPADILPEKNEYTDGKKVFHATSAEFDEFDFVRPGESDIGFHVGTSEQANSRLRSSGKNIREGERVLPLQLNKELKPARVPDVSFFSEPNRWRAELAVPTSEKNILRFLLDDAEDAALIAKGPTVRVGNELYVVNPQAVRQGVTKDEEFWKDLVRASVAAEKKLDTKNFENKKKWFDVLKGVANKHGYDSFVYKNQYEGSSEGGLDFLVDQIQQASKGNIDPSEVDMLSKFDDSYMLLEPDQAKGLFGGKTSGDPEFMKSKGGLI